MHCEVGFLLLIAPMVAVGNARVEGTPRWILDTGNDTRALLTLRAHARRWLSCVSVCLSPTRSISGYSAENVAKLQSLFL